MKPAIALALAATLFAGALPMAVAQDAPPPWRLLVFHAFRPGILSLCENAHLKPGFERQALPEAADPPKARWLTEAASVQWPGGRLAQPAGADVPPPPRLLTDACFTLFVDGVPVISGGVVHAYSARRFDFPALVVDQPRAGEPLQLTLAPRFPARPDEPVPARWAEVLKGLAGAGDGAQRFSDGPARR